MPEPGSAPPSSPTRTPLTARNAPLWTGADCPPTNYVIRLTDGDAEVVRAATAVAGRRLADLDLLHDPTVTAEDLLLPPRLRAILAACGRNVADGRGFALLRGLPVDDLDERASVVLLRGLVAHLGAVATQSRDGQLVRHVRSTGRQLGDAAVRGHETTDRLWFHTDGADAAVLLCRRAAESGGLSRLASAGTVHNLLLADAPQLLEELYGTFHFHMAGGQVPGLPPTFRSPIFSLHQGLFSCRYVRHTLLETPQVTGIPLPAAAVAAFDAIEDAAGRVSVDMELRPGDLQIVNNHTVLHSRTAYTDPVDPARARHLLRSWLTFAHYRGRRAAAVDEALRHGWLTDDEQRAAAATWAPPRLPDPAASR